MITDKDKFIFRKYVSSGKWKFLQVVQSIKYQYFRKTRCQSKRGLLHWRLKQQIPVCDIPEDRKIDAHHRENLKPDEYLTHTVDRIILLRTLHTIILCYTACTCAVYWNNESNFCSCVWGEGGWGGAPSIHAIIKTRSPCCRQSEDSSFCFLKRHFHTNAELFSMLKNVQNCEKSSRKFNV